MKKFILILFFIITNNVNAEFAIDIEYTKALSEFDVFTVNDLGIGESGYIYATSGICQLSDNRIGVEQNTKLVVERNKYSRYTKVTRNPKGKVKLSVPDTKSKSIAGIKLPSVNGKYTNLKSLVLEILKADSCDEEVFIVDSIEEVELLSELVEYIKKDIVAPDSNQGSISSESDDLSDVVWTWMVSEDKSKIDDSTNVTLMLSANEEIYHNYGGKVRPTLIIRCKDNKTDAYIVTGGMLDSNKSTIRLGSDKASSMTMSKSTGGKALFFRKPISFINKMWEYEKLTFRFSPYNSASQTVTFNIGGLKEEIEPLRKSCNW